jgi:hypothetical protein
MTGTVECPVEGCDYSGPQKSVLGHYSGKSDGLHPGGYQKAKTLLGDTQSSEPQSEPDPEPEPESTEPDHSSGTQPREQGSEPNPTFGGAEPVREPEPEQSTSQQPQRQQQSQSSMQEAGNDPVCPSCGGELFDFRQFTTGQYHKVNGESVYVRGDFQCSSCRKWWVDE